MFPPEYREPHLHRGARLLEPLEEERLPRHDWSAEGRQGASYEAFAEGWLRDEQAWGRPVDVLVMPDGALLVSDDQAGAVYRVSYR